MTTIQFSLFEDSPQVADRVNMARQNRDAGIKLALEKADRDNDGWSAKAYAFFIEFARNSKEPFMNADVVEAAKGVIPDPPDFRSYGAIAVRAIKAGVIKKIGYSGGSNPKHHRNPRGLYVYIKK